MSDFVLPEAMVDLASWPPLIMTSEPGSFAWHTMAVRVPRIAEETAAQNDFPLEIRAALADLHHELLHGTAQPLAEEAADRELWLASSAGYLGRPWGDVPWYWGEAYFYRRVLEATRYFQPGPWQGYDPFANVKNSEWQPGAAPAAVEALLAALPTEPAARFTALLHASLWGNRIDLSLRDVAARYIGGNGAVHEAGSEHALLVDDGERAWQALAGGEPGLVTLLADNAGTEQAMDLALIDHLLTAGLAARVALYLKPQPFFVSDATPVDLELALSTLAQGGAGLAQGATLAARLRQHLATGRLDVRTHWFFASSLCYYQLPAELIAALAGSRLVIAKGDANYRRLLGDAHWPAETSFAQVTSYFPAPLVALRTLKSELVVGLAEGQTAALAAADPQWSVNGSRGVIQGRL